MSEIETDLVGRLRAYSLPFEPEREDEKELNELLDEAADEIERLLSVMDTMR